MAACRACGAQADAAARFCASCGASLTVPAQEQVTPRDAPHERRRIVTVLFCDLVDSTALVDRFDPERIRTLQAHYAASAREIVVFHGGVVEKFVGDAVMAVFGIPRRHDDDADRACRAAADLGRSVRALSNELGEPIRCRIGIATGEVVATDDLEAGEQYVTGATVNTAARIQAAAAPDEVWLDMATADRVRSRAEIEPLGLLSLKGLADQVAGFRLVAISDASRDRPPFDTPIVGRDDELARLRQMLSVVRAAGRPDLVVVIGDAGVGKSRLCHELVVGARAEETTVLRAKCLPYGRGITFAPIAELIRAAADIGIDEPNHDAVAKVARLLTDIPDEVLVRHQVEGLLGLRAGGVPVHEMAWLVRRVIGHLAGRGLVLAIIDDAQWAEPLLLELLEDLAAQGVGPILVVCVARPALEETDPAWVGRRSEVLRLDTLGDDGVSRLIDDLFSGRAVMPDVRQRIASIGSGNALFLEQYTAMLVDTEAIADVAGEIVARRDLAELAVPASIDDLLAARLDALPAPEQRAAEHGAIAGRTFWQSSVAWLAATDEQEVVASSLDGLVRRALVLPDQSMFGDERAFRFRHLLVRDAAYASMTKRDRAALHRRFAIWLETKGRMDPAEAAAIIGYHDEQAYHYSVELGSPDRETGEAATGLLEQAGLAASERGDLAAAAGLLERAADTTNDRVRALRLRLRAAGYRWAAAPDAAARDEIAARVEALDREATAGGFTVVAANSRIVIAELGWRRGSVPPDEVAAIVEERTPLLRAAGDLEDLANALMLRSDVSEELGDWASVEEYARIAHGVARESGLVRLKVRTASFLTYIPLESWMPVPAGLAELDQLGEGQSDRVMPGFAIECRRSVLLAADGRRAEADAALDRARVLLERTDVADLAVWIEAHEFEIAETSGDYESAVTAASAVLKTFQTHGEGPDSTVAAGDVAHALLHLGRVDEAIRVLSSTGPVDPAGPPSIWLWHGTARVWAEAFVGDPAAALLEAKALAARATGQGRWHWEERAQETVLEIARRAGSATDEWEALGALRAIYERKGHRAGLARLERQAVRSNG